MFDAKSLQLLLQRGIDNGWWTVDHLDTPSPGLALLRREAIRHPDPQIRAVFSEGMKPHQNMLRELGPPERPEAKPSPRDFPEPPALRF
jgi:hypothetical protein